METSERSREAYTNPACAPRAGWHLEPERRPFRGRARRPRRNDHDLVGVRVGWSETELRAAVKKTGAIWRSRQKLWEMSWQAVRALGIAHRVVTG
jgi:hypothetical protein